MITKEGFESSIDLVALLMDRDLELGTHQNTTLDNLVATTDTYGNYTQGFEELPRMASDLHLLNGITLDENNNLLKSQHCVVLEHQIRVFTDAIRNHMAFARTVVAPKVKDLVATIAQHFDQVGQDSILNFEVKTEGIHGVLNNRSLQSALEKFKTIVPRPTNLVLDFAPLEDAELMDYLKVGASGVDSEISVFVDSVGFALVKDVWNTCFTAQRHPNFDLNEYIGDREQGINRALIVYLIASNLVAKHPNIPATTGEAALSLSGYLSILADFRNVSAVSLYLEISRYQERIKSGALVNRVEGKTVFVVDEVYKKWIADGGCNETLFGMVMSGQTNYYVSLIDERADELKRLWHLQVAVARRTEATHQVSTVKLIINKFVQGVISTSDDEVIKANVNLIYSNLDYVLDGVREDSLTNIKTLALRALCWSLYSHTDAEVILLGIDEAIAANPELTPMEAAAMSEIDYVTTWVAKQIRIV